MKMNLNKLMMALTTLGFCLGVVMEANAQGFGGFGGGFGGNRSSRGSSARTYQNNSEIGDAVITYDPETRRIVVIADEDTSQYVSQVITNLDRPKPQVLIKVVFLEVTYRKASDIGIQGTYGPKAIDDNGNVGALAQRFSGMEGLGSSTVQGLYTFTGSDYTATLRAIAEAGKLEVLSRPSVMARNNQQATILVGQDVPIITGSRYDNYGNQINSISYRSVGIMLTVTPFITPAGMIEMIVAPEISNLSDETVAISTGTNSVGAPVINRRSADTVVVTENAQTVVIGGLMENKKTESVSKIPFVGDIPLLGALFQRKTKNNVKTELIIFLTPYIVNGTTEMAALTARERDSVKKSFNEQDLNKFLEGIPVKDQTLQQAPAVKQPKPQAAPSATLPEQSFN
jgi:general secretion pathway protein D